MLFLWSVYIQNFGFLIPVVH